MNGEKEEPKLRRFQIKRRVKKSLLADIVLQQFTGFLPSDSTIWWYYSIAASPEQAHSSNKINASLDSPWGRASTVSFSMNLRKLNLEALSIFFQEVHIE